MPIGKAPTVATWSWYLTVFGVVLRDLMTYFKRLRSQDDCYGCYLQHFITSAQEMSDIIKSVEAYEITL